MPRKKIEFTEEQNFRIAQMVEINKSLQEIADTFNEDFGTSYTLTTIYKQIKSLGLTRVDKRTEAKETKIILNPEDILRLKSNWVSDSSIAKQLGVTLNALKKNIKEYDITYQKVKEFRENEYFGVKAIDLRTLKTKVANELFGYIKEFVGDVDVKFNHTIKLDNTDITIDIFFPDINSGFICETIDDLISKPRKDRKELVEIIRWSKYINKGHNIGVSNDWRKTNENDITDVAEAFGDGEIDLVEYHVHYTPTKKYLHYSEGLKVFTYCMKPNFEELVYDIKETAKSIVGDFITLRDHGYTVRDVDFKDPYLAKMKEMEYTVKERVYMPGSLDAFNEVIKEAAKRDRLNYKKECEQEHKEVNWKGYGKY